MAYSESKDLVKRTISDKISKDRAYEIARNCRYGCLPKSISKYGKKTGSRVSVNEQLAEEFYAGFKDNIWVADLAEMKSLSSKNKNVKYLLCVIKYFH